jgi:hypothetical protein
MADSDRCRRCGSIADTRPVSVKGQAPLDLCHRCFEASVAAHGRGGAVLVGEPAEERPQSRSQQRRHRAQAAEQPPEETQTEEPEGAAQATAEGGEGAEPGAPTNEGP